jgi:choline dehydrogenase-like flavoprotein
VIFSAGCSRPMCGRAARNSPPTEFSGIGPADELRSAGVEALQDLPGVGRNLHDHPLTSVVYPTVSRLASRVEQGLATA